MAKRFAEHNGLNLTQVNNDILEMWREKNVFWRSVDEREGCPQFVFFEGPPRRRFDDEERPRRRCDEGTVN